MSILITYINVLVKAKQDYKLINLKAQKINDYFCIIDKQNCGQVVKDDLKRYRLCYFIIENTYLVVNSYTTRQQAMEDMNYQSNYLPQILQGNTLKELIGTCKSATFIERRLAF